MLEGLPSKYIQNLTNFYPLSTTTWIQVAIDSCLDYSSGLQTRRSTLSLPSLLSTHTPNDVITICLDLGKVTRSVSPTSCKAVKAPALSPWICLTFSIALLLMHYCPPCWFYTPPGVLVLGVCPSFSLSTQIFRGLPYSLVLLSLCSKLCYFPS